MADTTTPIVKTSDRGAGGRPDKQAAVLTGALRVFARDGYTRATVDAIAARAGVSTRTIYNHFPDKARLFAAVIQASATRVAEAQIAVVDRHLRKVTDLETDLIEFGLDWASPETGDHAAHFALVRQINAEAGHIPNEVIGAWQEAGPLRVRRALADRLQNLADQGLLALQDPGRAAMHLVLLVSRVNPSYAGDVGSDQEIRAMVAAGVRTFLYGYHPV